MGLTPLIVARAQLLTAIELFFADRDPVSVQSPENAREMLETLCRRNNVEPMTELLLEIIRGQPCVTSIRQPISIETALSM